MQAVSAKEATVTPRLMRIILFRVADKCMLHTSLKTSRFSLISCHKRLASILLRLCHALLQVHLLTARFIILLAKARLVSRVCRGQMLPC